MSCGSLRSTCSLGAILDLASHVDSTLGAAPTNLAASRPCPSSRCGSLSMSCRPATCSTHATHSGRPRGRRGPGPAGVVPVPVPGPQRAGPHVGGCQRIDHSVWASRPRLPGLRSLVALADLACTAPSAQAPDSASDQLDQLDGAVPLHTSSLLIVGAAQPSSLPPLASYHQSSTYGAAMSIATQLVEAARVAVEGGCHALPDHLESAGQRVVRLGGLVP